MEFSYRISEAEYLNAAKLMLKGSVRFQSIKKSIMFWVAILAFLMFAISVFQFYRNQPSSTERKTVEAVPAEHPLSHLVENVVPAVLIAGAWFFLMFRLQPMLLRRRYRKDPSMQGLFTVNITPESISTENTAGASGRAGWNIYDYWREGKDIILLVFHSGAYLLVSLAGLSDAQQDELRGILTAALPKK